MKIFVTGAGGFIGSHLTEALVKAGHDVKALVYYNSLGNEEWLEHIDPAVYDKLEIVSGDVRDLSFVTRAVEGCDTVMHLAALIGIPYSYINPESYIDTNVKGTMNVMEAARVHGVKRVIHTSTSEVYGSAQSVPISEDHPLQGQSPYSASKIGADQMAYAYACSFDMPVVTLRPFNTFGPRQSLRAVIPTVVTQLLKGDGEVRVGAISPTRDFSHVEDTVSGFLAALDSDNADIYGEVINLGSNFEISIEEMVHMAADIIGKDVTISSEEERMRPDKSEVQRLYCDNAKAADILGWRPQYGGKDGFRQALENTIQWFAKEENLAFYKSDKYAV